jgi:uncharacterized protein YecA (UPF0149 family)
VEKAMRDLNQRLGLTAAEIADLQQQEPFKDPRGLRVQPRRVEKTPGRNEPCSCGSGIKFKRCCGG